MQIQWNKVTWYSKLIALVLFVALPFIGFYYGTQYGKTVALIGQTPPTAPTTTLPAYYSNTAEWQTDSNSNIFSIAYPIDFDAQDNNSATPYVTLTVPKAFEPQTNLADVTLTISANENNTNATNCLVATESGGPTMATSSVLINGVQFTVFQSSDAGAGNLYNTTSYRTVHAGECYAVEYTIHSSQIANYPASYNLRPFDESKINSLMQNIIGTFKFL